MALERGFERRLESSAEQGRNVEIVLKFIRHGERDKEGKLTDFGREVTRQRAKESDFKKGDFDAVKAIGSTGGPKGPTGQQRALETAHIYANEIAGDDAFRTKQEKVLSYETLKNPMPYDHIEIYNANLPADFDTLSEVEKVAAAKKAQTAVVNHIVSLKNPEAIAYKREAAGSFAYIIDHYQHMAPRLKSDSRVLIPAGSHGGLMEHLLQQTLIWHDETGQQRTGFSSLQELGGDFDPSEAFNVEIATDNQGNPGQLRVSFDDPKRPQDQDMHLDSERLQQLRDYYVELHKD